MRFRQLTHQIPLISQGVATFLTYYATMIEPIKSRASGILPHSSSVDIPYLSDCRERIIPL